MDADDIALSARLKTQFDFMEENPDILASGSAYQIFNSDRIKKYNCEYEKMPINLSTGLSGIGLGILFLLNHSFIEGDACEILEEIDIKIASETFKKNLSQKPCRLSGMYFKYPDMEK
jgi:hypothetical protein